ncbi:MAG: efflux RND transporter periplasmic adaptor subunit [Pseudomonadota bacterium]
MGNPFNSAEIWLRTAWASALSSAVILTGCSEAEVAPLEAPTVRPAKLIEVSSAQLERSFRLPAIVGAADSSILTFQVGGLLQELQIIEGTEVERGQLLAQLDQRDFRNSVASARATFDNAQVEFTRAERLISERAIAQSVFDQRRSQRDVARASLDSALKSLDDTVIRAPFDGVVADIHVESFETVSPSQPILTLQSAGDAEVVIQVPASIVVNVERLQPIELLLELDAAPNLRLPATFVSSASVADATTQTFEARFAFSPPPDLLILPGMTGLLNGRFRVPAEEADTSGVSVPLSAILSEAGDTYVWRVDPDEMTVTRTGVSVSPGVGENVIVTAGLGEGDLIVGAGGAYLTEGAEIRAYEE